MTGQYLILNDKLLRTDEVHIDCFNRSFLYGDGLFETIRCTGTNPLFFDLHWKRLTDGMKVLKMKTGKGFTLTFVKNAIERLLNKSRIYKGARVRLTVFRNSGGFYTPEDNGISWLVQASAIKDEVFELNQKGLSIDMYDEVRKPVDRFANLKTNNALLYVMAGIWRREQGLDECFIQNQYGRIAEMISSNVFIAKENKLTTPPLSEGCIAGTMRQTIIQLAVGAGYTIEEKGILEKNILEADEIFITNAIQGIRWVGAYKDRRYFNFVTKRLINLLNQKLDKND